MRRISEICKTFVPVELINHIWNIVDLYDENSYVFVLSSRRQGDEMVQDITTIMGNNSSIHTILGYKPVDFTIKVSRQDDDFEMSLIPSAKAALELNKWERRRAFLLFRKKLIFATSPNTLRVRRA
ncbi:MAG: hypothetical protein KBI01_02120 [Oscillospiraceae bacterium]|nr:hypothetical protein [Oscillospiraceae bacterium]